MSPPPRSMSSQDVGRLFQALEMGDFSYQEIVAEESGHIASGRWPLLALVDEQVAAQRSGTHRFMDHQEIEVVGDVTMEFEAHSESE